MKCFMMNINFASAMIIGIYSLIVLHIVHDLKEKEIDMVNE